MKIIAATLVALSLLTGAAQARATGGYFGDLKDTAPRSVFDGIQESAPRSPFDGIRDSAPRSPFDEIQGSAPRAATGTDAPPQGFIGE